MNRQEITTVGEAFFLLWIRVLDLISEECLDWFEEKEEEKLARRRNQSEQNDGSPRIWIPVPKVLWQDTRSFQNPVKNRVNHDWII